MGCWSSSPKRGEALFGATGSAGGGALAPGALVVVHLANPSEKFWGVLESIDPVGLTLRGIGLDSFDTWARQVASTEPPSLGLATMFAPLFRVERVFLDEQVGEVESYRQRFARYAGLPAERFLGLDRGAADRPS